MKRVFLIAVVSILFVLCAFGKTYKVTASRLNVRNAPNSQGAVLGSLPQSKEIEVVKINNGWAEIKFNGQKAYVSAQYLTPVSVSVAASATSESRNSSASGASKTASSSSSDSRRPSAGFNSHCASGFHVSLGAFYSLHSARAYVGSTWRDVKFGTKDLGNGLEVGLGLEYNGVLHHGERINICLGFRSGVYYSWSGTKKLDQSDFDKINMELPAETYRASIHSITIPLQAQFALEFRGGRMAAGVFSGPVFELFVANNTIEDFGEGNVLLSNEVSGKSRWIKGDGWELEVMDKADRKGVLNLMWGTGAFIQFNKFRISLETDWGLYYRYTRGGTVDGEKVDPIKAHLNKLLVAGFQIVF